MGRSSKKDTKTRLEHLVAVLENQSNLNTTAMYYGLGVEDTIDIIVLLGETIIALETNTTTIKEAKETEQGIYLRIFESWRKQYKL